MPARFFLEVEEGERAGERIPLEEERLTLGRRPENVVVFRDARVSGNHAEIVLSGEHYVLRDLGSTNGTYLEGKKVEEVVLSPGDRFTIGGERLRFLDAQQAEATPKRLAAAAPPARRSLVLPLSLVLALGIAAALYFQFGRGGGGDRILPVAVVPGNLLSSPSFEFVEGEDPRAAWAAGGEAGATFSVGPEGRHTGASGVFVAFEGPAAATLEHVPEVRVEEEKTYRISASARGEGCAVALRAGFFAAGRPEYALVRGGDFAEEPSGRVEATVRAPRGADRAKVFVVASGASGRLSLDDVAFVPGEVERATLPAVNEVTLQFDPIETGLRRITEPWIAGLGVAVEEDGTRWEAATSLSPGSGEIRLPSGSAGRLRAEAEGTATGFRIRYAFERSGGALPLLVARILPAYLSQGGVTVVGAGGASEYSGDFAEDAVGALVLGEEPGRMRFAFDPPLPVQGVEGEGGLQITAPFEANLSVTVQVSFQEERRQARNLLHEARRLEQEGQPGEAIARYDRLLAEFPFEKESLEAARAGRADLLARGLKEVEGIEMLADEARFFRISSAYRRAQESAATLAALYAGTDVEERVRRILSQIESEAQALEESRREREAERRRRLATELEASGSSELAALVRRGLPEGGR
jgi:hypothetical protein